MSKVKIELTPYNAMAIFSFLKEWINEDLPNEYKFKAIIEAVKEYENSLINNITDKQIEECTLENNINQMIGKSPVRS